MIGFLTNNQIEYVLYHLNLTVNLNDELRRSMCFIKSENQLKGLTQDIIFIQSSKEYNENSVIYVEDLPVLFPNSSKINFYIIENNKLIFHHDILKSCFFLLSGYQEYQSGESDQFGRFKYSESVQKKLGFITKPLVNYYFGIIIRGINEFLKTKGLKVEKKLFFDKFAFFLTHDIDYIDYFTFNRLLYKFKEVTGFVKSYYSFKTNIKHILETLIELLKFNKKKNPSWSFKYLRTIEKEHGYRSAFYFLHKDLKHQDSKYLFSEERVKGIFKFLIDENCEIGIHGNVRSVENKDAAKHFLKKINQELPFNISGIRQHRLLYKLPKTALIHEELGIKYDSTLCFAEHEGFRNSFCLPFKLYDFENDRMINVWQIPLNVMDVTLFHYRNLNLSEAKTAIKTLISEVKKFNGVFTLLWHNDFFDEDRYHGIKAFYTDIHHYIKTESPESCLGYEIIKKCSES